MSIVGSSIDGSECRCCTCACACGKWSPRLGTNSFIGSETTLSPDLMNEACDPSFLLPSPLLSLCSAHSLAIEGCLEQKRTAYFCIRLVCPPTPRLKESTLGIALPSAIRMVQLPCSPKFQTLEPIEFRWQSLSSAVVFIRVMHQGYSA